MIEVLCEIFLSVFFVYGLYSAMRETKCMLRKLVKRISAIDKKQI